MTTRILSLTRFGVRQQQTTHAITEVKLIQSQATISTKTKRSVPL